MAQVGSIRHKLGTLAGEVAAVSVSLNGSPVAKLFELRAQLEVLAPGPLDTSTPSRVTAASAASGAFGASGGLAGTPPLSGVGLLGDLELPEDSDSVQLGFDGETPTGTPEAAGFRSKGVPEQGRSGQAGMPFSGDPVELHKARQRAGIPADKTPAVMVCFWSAYIPRELPCPHVAPSLLTVHSASTSKCNALITFIRCHFRSC